MRQLAEPPHRYSVGTRRHDVVDHEQSTRRRKARLNGERAHVLLTEDRKRILHWFGELR
jgi:hypothetical protein